MVIHHNFPLSQILFYKIGGNARIVLEARTADDVLEAVGFIKNNKIEQFLVVGLGANLLMHDREFKGAIIWITKGEEPDMHLTSDGLIASFAGQTLDDLIQFSFVHQYVGLESLGGLPSTIGGAIRGNAGAFGTEMGDVLEKVEAVALEGEEYRIREFTNAACQFSYRDSIFKKNPKLIILKGFFHLQPASDEEVDEAKKVYHEMSEYRKKHHPIEYPSCGSVFKNIREPEKVKKILAVWPDIEEQVKSKWHGKVSMGYIVKRLGFVGLTVGGAKITEKHGNYICNVGGAKAVDVKAIIDEVEKKFKDTFGFSPELEAEIIQ